MTLHYPDTDAMPSSFAAAGRNGIRSTDAETGESADDIVPIYARKPVRKNYNKKLLMTLPVVIALGVGAWALVMGESSRPANEAAAVDSTEGLTTSRLDAAQPVSLNVDVPALTEAAPLEAMQAPVARRAAAPKRRAAAPAAALVPDIAKPYSSPALTTAITEPASVVAPPPIMAPAPVMPTDPAPTEAPPGS